MTITRVPHPYGGGFSLSSTVAGPGRTVYVSGILAPGETLAAQAEGSFDLIAQILSASGATLADVVRITAYLTDLGDYAQFDAVRAARFEGAPPASSAVQVAGLLQGASIEIDVVAFLDD